MFGFRNMTFCTQSECKFFNKGCDRALTESVKKQAEKWWGKPGAPVYTFSDTPCCFEKNDG